MIIIKLSVNCYNLQVCNELLTLVLSIEQSLLKLFKLLLFIMVDCLLYITIVLQWVFKLSNMYVLYYSGHDILNINENLKLSNMYVLNYTCQDI